MSIVKKIAQENLPWAIAHRRHLHRYPEPSFEEKMTSSYCQRILKELGYVVKPVWGFGFIADLDLSEGFNKIAWRTEMDALLMLEKNEHDFVSENRGVAHMCGHDMHMAIALLAAKIISENKHLIKNNVRFIFQPAEEMLPGGALSMIENGCLEGVSEVYALHNTPLEKSGMITATVGAMTAATSAFELKIFGKGTHVGTPHMGLDPLTKAALLVSGWQSEILRKIDPSNPIAFSVTNFHSGMTLNVVPDEALIGGSFRVVNQKDFSKVLRMITDSICFLKKEGFSCVFNLKKGYPATINSSFGVNRVLKAAQRVVDKSFIKKYISTTLFGEDFSYYLQKRKGAFFFLGIQNKKENITEPQHSSKFEVDEQSIQIGAAVAVELMI